MTNRSPTADKALDQAGGSEQSRQDVFQKSKPPEFSADSRQAHLEMETNDQELKADDKEKLSKPDGQTRAAGKTLQWDIRTDKQRSENDVPPEVPMWSPYLRKQPISPTLKPIIQGTHAQSSPEENKRQEVKERPTSRSPLSPIFDTGQSKSRGVICDFIPSRSNSRQGRYHEECTPKDDPSLVVGSRTRLLSAELRRSKSEKRRRPSSIASNGSLLSHRESVVNLIYSGRPEQEDQVKCDSPERRYLLDRRASSVLSRITLPFEQCTVQYSDYPLVQEDDYSRLRTSLSHSSVSPQSEPSGYKSGFLYQETNFDSLTENVPTFVRHHIKKNGRFMTESFILRVNYLRRRRQLGEISSTISKRSQQQMMVVSPGGGGGGSGGEGLCPLLRYQNSAGEEIRKSDAESELSDFCSDFGGSKFCNLQYLYRIPPCTISRIVHEICIAIYDVLKEKYLPTPRTEEDWQRIAEGFERRWNFPNCLGAIEGKHIALKAPTGQGSVFYNYKHFHSIILLALVDSSYKFIYVDVGANGRSGDAGVFRDSPLFKRLETGTLHVPPAKPLPGTDCPSPFVIVGDDAFPLKPYLLKPFPVRYDVPQQERERRRIFDYRLSRAHCCAENAFGIMVQRFAVFQTTILLGPEKATNVTLAALALHNYLMKEMDMAYSTGIDHKLNDNNLRCIQSQHRNRSGADARGVREIFSNYIKVSLNPII